MKLWVAGLALRFCPVVFAQQSVPEIPFDSVPNVPDMNSLPANVFMGEGAAVTTNSKGHIFVFSRGNTSGPAYAAQASQLLEFGPDGKFIREIGHNLYAWSFAHTVKVDHEDNVWVTDKGSDMVIKFTPEGRVDMVFGRKPEASDEDTAPLKHPNPPLPPRDGFFRQVTDVAWDAARNAYISDGYINSRVAKVDKDGNWLKSWGERGTGPGQFHTPHSIAVDAGGSVYVADTAATAAPTCSTARAHSCASSPSTLPCLRTRSRRSGTCPTKRLSPPARSRPAPRGRSASRRRRTKFFTLPMAFPAASTS